MSGRRLPSFLEPRPFASRGVSLDGVIALAEFTRLAELVVPVEGSDVRVRLKFSRDADGHALVCGDVSAQVLLRCDRCIEEVAFELTAQIDIAVVADEAEARSLIGTHDALVLAEPRIRPAELLEDDLLLSLPRAACADFETCPRRPQLVYGDGTPAEQDRESPFKVLEALKTTDT